MEAPAGNYDRLVIIPRSYPDSFIPVLLFFRLPGMLFLCFILNASAIKKGLNIYLYWTCQIGWWSLNSFYWNYMGTLNGTFNLWVGIVHYILDMLICIGLTHGYRSIVLKKKWHLYYIGQLVKRIIPVILVMAILYSVLVLFKNYEMQSIFVPDFSQTFRQYCQTNWLIVFVGGLRLMLIWVLAYHLYLYTRREINTTKENARLTIIAKEATLQKLSAQLNPHFFFNSLNTIKALVLDNPPAARRAIDLLSDLLRTSLYSKEDLWISIKEELDLVKDYLELEKLRFEERLIVKINAAESALPLMIPVLSIQTLVENAIKHGISNLKEGGLIEVTVERKDKNIQIIVSNPGILHAAVNASNGLGLKNLKERLQLQCNGQALLAVAQQNNQTIHATLIIPGV